MSAPYHGNPYVPNYMMKQSLWNMGQQISELQSMITPKTQLMAWQPHLVSQAQRDIQNVHSTIAYNKEVHGGQGYGAFRSHAYGDCGVPTGCSSCAAAAAAKESSYGGCGTFFGLTRDPIKRACVVERKLSRMERACSKGRRCSKRDKLASELTTLQMETGTSPDTLRTARDSGMDEYAARTARGEEEYGDSSRRTDYTLWVVGAVGVTVIGVAIYLTR